VHGRPPLPKRNACDAVFTSSSHGVAIGDVKNVPRSNYEPNVQSEERKNAAGHDHSSLNRAARAVVIGGRVYVRRVSSIGRVKLAMLCRSCGTHGSVPRGRIGVRSSVLRSPGVRGRDGCSEVAEVDRAETLQCTRTRRHEQHAPQTTGRAAARTHSPISSFHRPRVVHAWPWPV